MHKCHNTLTHTCTHRDTATVYDSNLKCDVTALFRTRCEIAANHDKASFNPSCAIIWKNDWLEMETKSFFFVLKNIGNLLCFIELFWISFLLNLLYIYLNVDFNFFFHSFHSSQSWFTIVIRRFEPMAFPILMLKQFIYLLLYFFDRNSLNCNS